MKWERIIRNTLFLLTIVMLLAALSACAGQTVHALDYTLEDELYIDGTDEQGSFANEENTPEEIADSEQSGGEQEETVPESEQAQEMVAESTPTPEIAQQLENAEEDNSTEPTPEPASDGTEDAEATPTPANARYSIFVRNDNGEALADARVKLYMDGALLYSAVTDADGSVFWMLPTGHTYCVKTEKDGYLGTEETDASENLTGDLNKTITLTKKVLEMDAAEPTLTPISLPTPAAGKVTITAVNTGITAGDTGFSLLDGVSARTESGETAPVWVVDDGGFIDGLAGEYHVTYGAMQQDELITVTRIILVTADNNEEMEGVVAEPTSSSAERYEILLAYRNEICDALTAKITDLTEEYKCKIDQITEAGTNVRIMAQVPVGTDTDSESTAPPEYSQVQEARVKNWPDVLATFIAESSLDVDNPMDLMQLRLISLDGLDDVFWRMNPVNVIRMDGVTNVILDSKTYEEMADEYGMDAKRESFLYELMQPEFLRTFATLTGNIAFLDATSADIEQIRASLPEDMSIERKDVVEVAFSLVGKVTYLWGGKYNKLGWNEKWGLPCKVTTQQDGESVVVERTGGLDCSGFASWVFINAIGDPSVIDAIGNGTSSQWAHSESISWDEGEPGDLAFFAVPGERDYNHVGIIVSVDEDGSYLVAHCSSRKNGVIVTDAWSTGFRYLRRPLLYGD